MKSSCHLRCIAILAIVLGATGLACGKQASPGSGGGSGGKASGAGGGTLATSATGGAGGMAKGGTSGSTGGAGQNGGAGSGNGGAASGGSQAGGTTSSSAGGTGGRPQEDAAITQDLAATGGAGGDAANKDLPSGSGGVTATGGQTVNDAFASTGGTTGRDASLDVLTTGGATGTGGATRTGGSTGTGGTPNLWEKYADYFPIGAAVDTKNYNSATLTKHFNSITAEDQMKFDALEPSENSFSYGTADQLVDFAVGKKMKVRGHTMVWHRQTPAWVFANASKDVLLSRMRNHITNVMKHFKGKVYAWDVVNEAIMDTGDFRTGNENKDDQKSQWYAIAGKDYIAEAFKAAYAADPTAKLYYNDFYDYIPAKRQGIYTMLKELLAAGVPVHGVGLQSHLNIEPSTDPANQAYHQTVANLEEAIKLYSSLGLDVQITELDLSLYIPGVTYTSETYYTASTFTTALQTQQADRYRAFFDMFRKYKGVITGVTFWGISDDNTWLSEFSSGRKDFPLLFDVNQQPKKAFFAVVDF